MSVHDYIVYDLLYTLILVFINTIYSYKPKSIMAVP